MKWCFIAEADSVCPVYVRELRRAGHEAHCLMDSPYDPFGMSQTYSHLVECRAAIRTQWLARFPRLKHVLGTCRNALTGRLPMTGRRGEMVRDADVIFLSGRHYIFDRLRRTFPRKKIILHYRGTELRTARGPDWAEQESRDREADVVTCSTPDLLPICKRRAASADKAHYLPNPIDTEMFAAPEGGPPRDRGALRILNPTNHEPTVAELCRRHIPPDIPVSVHPRTARYADMPALFARYTHYVDWAVVPKGGGPNPAWSNLGRQAQASGLTVFGHDLLPHPPSEFPPEQRPEAATRLLTDLVESP